MHSAANLEAARSLAERGRPRAAARMLLALGTPQAAELLDLLAPHGAHGAVLAERLRFGPPETWLGWRRGDGRVVVKLWTEPPPPVVPVAHSGLAPLLDSGTSWRVFAWIAGQTLARLHARAMPLDGVALMAAIEETVAALHAAGQAHGDLTPANVIVTPAGTPVLIDWGEDVAGTPGWCPDHPTDAMERDRHALAKLAALLLSGAPTAANRP